MDNRVNHSQWAAIEGPPGKKASGSGNTPAANMDSPSAKPGGSNGQSRYDLLVFFEEGCGMENLRAYMLTGLLQEHCEILRTQPANVEEDAGTAVEIVQNGFFVSVRTELDPRSLGRLVKGKPHVASVQVTPISLGAGKGPGAATDMTYRITALFEEDCGMENLRALMLMRSLEEVCRVLDWQPVGVEDDPQTAEAIVREGFCMTVQAGLSPAQLEQIVLGSPHVRSTSICPHTRQQLDDFGTPEKPSAGDKPAQAPLQGRSNDGMGRSKPDRVLELIEALAAAEAAVEDGLRGQTLSRELQLALHRLHTLTSELYSLVNLVPVNRVAQQLRRTIQEQGNGRALHLVTLGDMDIEVDRSVGTALACLVHSCLGHGTPESTASKSVAGNITLSAEERDSEILVKLSYDGGLDTGRLLELAKIPLQNPDHSSELYRARTMIGKLGGSIGLEKVRGPGVTAVIKLPRGMR